MRALNYFSCIKRRKGFILLLGVTVSACLVMYSYNLDSFRTGRNVVPGLPQTDTSDHSDTFVHRNILNDKTDKVFKNSIRKMLEKHTTLVNSDASVTHKRMQALVIVAGYRTGSSFIGQMFNQHPNVFYLFEPLYFSKRHLTPELNAKVLEDLLLCNITTLHRETIRIWNEELSQREPKAKGIDHCLAYGICFREKSRALCTPDMCGGKSLKYCRYCPRARLNDIERKCREAQLRVIKVIRVSDISQLKKSWKNKNIDLKILHLVRDPRSTALSRYKLNPTRDMELLIGRTCKVNAANHGHVINKEENYRWLEGIYKLIRYEDSLIDPQSFARELYDFVGHPSLTVHPEVASWIRKSTTSAKGNSYSTSRNIEKQKSLWRMKITFSATQEVQTKCEAAMNMLGYRLAHSEGELRNLNVTLIRKPRTGI